MFRPLSSLGLAAELTRDRRYQTCQSTGGLLDGGTRRSLINSWEPIPYYGTTKEGNPSKRITMFRITLPVIGHKLTFLEFQEECKQRHNDESTKAG